MTSLLTRHHPLHDGERVWQETNCYADLWIEVLHARGLDPVPALAAALQTGFDGEQWTFVKPHPQDLQELYGASVTEVNVWRPLLVHVLDHLGRGRTVTVEVDSFWLPDTAATTYRSRHAKTTIAVIACDGDAQSLAYCHGPGSFTLDGEDFEGVLRTAGHDEGLPPYVEAVTWTPGVSPTVAGAAAAAARCAALRPPGDQAEALAERLRADLPAIRDAGVDGFHDYAFGTARQCGASLLLCADVLAWLAAAGADADLVVAAEAFAETAQAARVVQLQLARVAAGRRASIDDALDPLVEAWRRADAALDQAGLARAPRA